MHDLRRGGSDRVGRQMSSFRGRDRGWFWVLGVAGLCWAMVAIWGLVFGCERSMAATGHVFLTRLSEAPGGTVLREPGVVAVDQTSGDVFVADPGAGMVDVFSSSGVFLTQFGAGQVSAVGVAVDEASGDVYVADLFRDRVVFKPDGPGGRAASEVWRSRARGSNRRSHGIAVDNSKSGAAGTCTLWMVKILNWGRVWWRVQA